MRRRGRMVVAVDDEVPRSCREVRVDYVSCEEGPPWTWKMGAADAVFDRIASPQVSIVMATQFGRDQRGRSEQSLRHRRKSWQSPFPVLSSRRREEYDKVIV